MNLSDSTLSKTSPPIETRVGRADRTESIHRAVAVAISLNDAPMFFGEDPGTFMRSVAKPFQTLALFRNGVVDHHGLSPEEIAVISASHGGEREHRRRVEGLLRRGGFTLKDLHCGTHAPFTASERRRMIAGGEKPDLLCNNCSGKHAGMLLHAAHLGADSTRYLDRQHPVQRAVASTLSMFLDVDLSQADCGIDGCGAPTWFVSLEAMARGFARLSDQRFLEERGLVDAVDRYHDALRTAPLLFSGEQRFPYLWSHHLQPESFSKEGAEGVYVVWGTRGALALKSTDGTERGYRYAIPELLSKLGWIDGRTHRRWIASDPPIVRNVAGREVGQIEVSIPEPRMGA